uniref:Uncharacterized protein n=1 Tax=Rangifer tarandus platyrhynchus TaxID=3082113 RepID=A0ACB0E7P5_RANTA|nr:unnamed protein product [Rangifer tarandus platyrhynchus]
MLFDPRNVIRLESQGWTGVLVEPPPTAERLISTRRPPRLCSPSQPLRSPSVSTRERSPQVPDPRGSKASTPTREGLTEAWPKPCSLGPRNPVVGQRHPGAERPPPLGCRGEGEGEVCCGFRWVAVVRALRPRKTAQAVRVSAPPVHLPTGGWGPPVRPPAGGPGPGAPNSPAGGQRTWRAPG